MPQVRLDRRFFASTRGRIVMLLRREVRTVDDLARELNLTENAIRAHLAALERDGLVHQRGVRRGTRKPSSFYELTPEGERLFVKAYGPVLDQLVGLLAEHMGLQQLEELLRATGRRMAAAEVRPPGGRRERLEAAAGVLNRLGGMFELEEQDGRSTLCGYSCPLSDLVAEHPQFCLLAEAMVSELAGVTVKQQCSRKEPVWCRLEVQEAG